MRNKISDFLNVILGYLKAWQMPVCKFLNDGISESEIEKSFHEAGLIPNKELIELYQWRNGTEVEEGSLLDDLQIIPGYHFLSLPDAVKSYLAMREDKRWNPLWFPVFANGGGDFYAVDLSKSDGEFAPIIGFILGELEQEVEYQNITTMLLTFSECFEKGIVFKTEDGYLEMDDDRQARIARKNNPDVEFWRT